MGQITVDISSLSNYVSELDNIQKYYLNKKSSFYGGTYSASSSLSSYLSKIQGIYTDISNNVKNVKEFVELYNKDVQGLENLLGGKTDAIREVTVSRKANEVKGTIRHAILDSNNLFEVSYVNTAAVNKVKYQEDNPLGHAAATVGTCALSFVEGVFNVVEMLADGGAMLVSGACSLFGADATAESIGNWVENDITKNAYYSSLSFLGWDKYADPDSTAANLCSVGGNILGFVGLTVLTAGAAGAAGTAAGGASLAGGGTLATAASASAATKTAFGVGVNAFVGMATNAGSESENALRQGATIEEAQDVGAVAGLVGLLEGSISGKFDLLAEGAKGIGELAKWTVASFGVSSTEPLINLMASTEIYKNDGESSYIENLVRNANEEGLLFQMALAGGTAALGTGFTGLKYGEFDNPFKGVFEKIKDLKNKEPSSIQEVITEKLFADIDEKLVNIEDVITDTGVEIEPKTIIETAKIFPTEDMFGNVSNVKNKEPSSIQEVITEKLFADIDEKLVNIEDVITDTGVEIEPKTIIETAKIFPTEDMFDWVDIATLNIPKKYLTFSNEHSKAVKQLTKYFGDAGVKVTAKLKVGKTIPEIMNELTYTERKMLKNFIDTTPEGQYLVKLTKEEIEALNTYTGGAFNEINSKLRNKPKTGKIEGEILGISAQTLVDNIDSAIAKYGGLDETMEIFRAVRVSSFIKHSPHPELFDGFNLNDLDKVAATLETLVGKRISDLGYMSASPSYSGSFAKTPSCNLVLDIIAEKGTPGAYINQLSNFYNVENEFLFARGTSLRIVEVSKPTIDINGNEKIFVKCVVAN